jgi:hypothetical protein
MARDNKNHKKMLVEVFDADTDIDVEWVKERMNDLIN